MLKGFFFIKLFISHKFVFILIKERLVFCSNASRGGPTDGGASGRRAVGRLARGHSRPLEAAKLPLPAAHFHIKIALFLNFLMCDFSCQFCDDKRCGCWIHFFGVFWKKIYNIHSVYWGRYFIANRTAINCRYKFCPINMAVKIIFWRKNYFQFAAIFFGDPVCNRMYRKFRFLKSRFLPENKWAFIHRKIKMPNYYIIIKWTHSLQFFDEMWGQKNQFSH